MRHRCVPWLAGWMAGVTLCPVLAAPPSINSDKYMSADQLRPGMRGFGRTVMAGAEISTFNVEVLSVMRNAFYAKRDVILVRCSGAGLENSGIIAGMSGSPVYITDENGKDPRMIGAIAYGFPWSKDPIGGVQPIYQMLAIQGVTDTADVAKQPAVRRGVAPPFPYRTALTESRFAPLIDTSFNLPATNTESDSEPSMRLRPLRAPLMVGGAAPATMDFVREQLADTPFEPVASGGFARAGALGNVKLEPGSALCVPLVRGDITMDVVGTCTDVIGDRVLAFGHPFLGLGSVDMPMATGAIHTVIPSTMRSFKLGSSLDVVGRLFGDENTGIAGRFGDAPAAIPVDMVIHWPSGERRFHYDCLHQELYTPFLLMVTLYESVFEQSELPIDHTIDYSMSIAFKDLGTFESKNTTSMASVRPIMIDLMSVAFGMMDNEFGRARIESVRAELTIKPEAQTAYIERAVISQNRVKPGESIAVDVLWRRYKAESLRQTYTIDLPEDLPEGQYKLTIGSAATQIEALREEKPYLFEPHNMASMLAAMQRIAAFRDDRVYLRLRLPRGGLNIGPVVFPELPSFRRRILADAKRTDVGSFVDALVVEKEAPFVVNGSRDFTIQVSKHADQ